MFVHCDNLTQKENHPTKYRDDRCRQYLAELRPAYDRWRAENLKLNGPGRTPAATDMATIEQRVALLNQYKDFVDQQKYAEAFDSRSNLHSTVLEEFMYYLFRDLAASLSANALIGKSNTFKDLFFQSDDFRDMLDTPRVLIEKKVHDFAIGITLQASFQTAGPAPAPAQIESWDIPAVAIECKTYLDKTMLQDASTAAEELKHRNPNAMYIVVAEWLKLTEAVNLRKSKIDQIYVLRRQRNTDREYRYAPEYVKNPIYFESVAHLFSLVRGFLTIPWETGIASGLARGHLL